MIDSSIWKIRGLQWLRNHYSNYNKKLERFEIEFLKNHLHGRVLEVGCGFGRLLRHLSHCEVFGLDLVHENLEEAKKSIIDGIFICSDVKYLGNVLRPKSFDCVFSCEHLQHISDEDCEVEIESMRNLSKSLVVLIESGPYQLKTKYFVSRDYRKLIHPVETIEEFSDGQYHYQALSFRP